MLVHVDRVRLLGEVVGSDGTPCFSIYTIVHTVLSLLGTGIEKTIAMSNLLFHLGAWFQPACVLMFILLGGPPLPPFHIPFREFLNIDSLS